MREIKLSVTFYLPDLTKLGLVLEPENEVKQRTLKLHQKFSDKRKQLDLEFKRKKFDVEKYHHQLLQLSQDQFAYSFFIGWRRVFLTFNGKRKTVVAIVPS